MYVKQNPNTWPQFTMPSSPASMIPCSPLQGCWACSAFFFFFFWIIKVLFKIKEHLKINNIIDLNVYWNIEKCFQITLKPSNLPQSMLCSQSKCFEKHHSLRMAEEGGRLWSPLQAGDFPRWTGDVSSCCGSQLLFSAPHPGWGPIFSCLSGYSRLSGNRPFSSACAWLLCILKCHKLSSHWRFCLQNLPS